jgi:hypothetical protein
VAVTPGVWLPALGGESLTPDTLQQAQWLSSGGGALVADQTLLRITNAGRARTDRVTNDTFRSREKVTSVANFIFTFFDAMG